MDTRNILAIIQLIIGVLLVAFILLQQRGSGLSVTFGGTGGGEFYHSRRGIEKFLHYSTITLGIVMVVLSLVAVFVY